MGKHAWGNDQGGASRRRPGHRRYLLSPLAGDSRTDAGGKGREYRGRSGSLPRWVGACCGSHTAWPAHLAADGEFQGVMRKVFVRLAKAVRPTSKELS